MRMTAADPQATATLTQIEEAIGQPIHSGDVFNLEYSQEGTDLVQILRDEAIIFQGRYRIQEGPAEVPAADRLIAEYEAKDNWEILRAIGQAKKDANEV